MPLTPAAVWAGGGIPRSGSFRLRTRPRPEPAFTRFKRDGASLASFGPSQAFAEAAALQGDSSYLLNRRAVGFTGQGRYKRKLRRYRQGMKGSKRGRRMRGRGLYSGTGGFWSDWKGRLGAGFKAGATAMGFGGAANALTTLENAGRSIGMGAYETPVSNSIVDGGTGTDIPSFSAGGPGIVVISHKEYIGDVFGPEAAGQFQNTVYSINPGLTETFPWLSQVAANYEEYTLKQCIFTYRSTVTDFVATGGQVGTIVMASQYNPSDAPFANKQDAMEYDLAMSGKVSQSMLHGVECDPAQLSGSVGKYTRSGPVRSDQDLKSYDHANLNVCVTNIPQAFANQALGELWVSYTVELRKPKFFVSRGLNIQRDTFVASNPNYAVDGDITGFAKFVDAGLYAMGQQNRIGLQLTTSKIEGEADLALGAVRCRFPATFSGTVAIKLNVVAGAAPGVNAPGIGTYTVASGGTSGLAMFTISDMWALNYAGDGIAWEPYTQSFTQNTEWAEAAVEWHFNILTPTSAGSTIDNFFDMLFPTKCRGWQLDVSVYNTAFNYPTSGNIIIENPVTSVIEPWP
nr:MAG: capsid protein [Chemarfal virus 38]